MNTAQQTRASMPNKEPMLKEELKIEIDSRARSNHSEYHHPRIIPAQILSWLSNEGYKVDPKPDSCVISW